MQVLAKKEVEQIDLAILRYRVYDSLPGVKMVNRTKWKINVYETLMKLMKKVKDDSIILIEMEEKDVEEIKNIVLDLFPGINYVGKHLVPCAHNPYLYWMIFSFKNNKLESLNTQKTLGTKHPFVGYCKLKYDLPFSQPENNTAMSTKEVTMSKIYKTLGRGNLEIVEYFGDSNELGNIIENYNRKNGTQHTLKTL